MMHESTKSVLIYQKQFGLMAYAGAYRNADPPNVSRSQGHTK